MEDQLKTKEELIHLLSNCVLAVALGEDDSVKELGQICANQHAKELTERFPGWEAELLGPLN